MGIRRFVLLNCFCNSIPDQAGRIIAIVTGKELLRRGKGPGKKSARLQHARQRFAQGFVIVHDCDNAGVG